MTAAVLAASPPAARPGAPRVALCFVRFGPYHRARAAALARHCEVHEVEFSRRDGYGWAYEQADAVCPRVTLSAGRPCSTRALRATVHTALSRIAPDVVAVPGWSEPAALAVLAWARERNVPAVLMSESNADDTPRSLPVELAKARALRGFSAALVGGSRASDYVRALGMPNDRVFLGYDAVDNTHFRAGALAARCRAEKMRSRLGAPPRYFLASARFVPKKNHLRLLLAYARYRALAGEAAIDLVLLGDGELRPVIEAHRRALGIEDHVRLPGFRQYDELPAWYGLATAFVHPSTTEQWGLVVNEAMAAGLPVLVSERCGCAPELVDEGANGHTFAPFNVGRLAGLMHRVAHGHVDRLAMARAGMRIVADWGPERFAAGLLAATRAALAGPAPPPRWPDRLLLRVLVHR